ncbi:hypothetical protein [Prochlorococcus sp. MIT 1201]|uniref:hypothetical protein n=1 Tax=Prochlorococcus sp. MIT 1201 TaxID=3082535 RepID=UPI0039A4E6AA
MATNDFDASMDEELTEEEFNEIAGGRISIKDLADRLNVPTNKRRNFYTRLMSPKGFLSKPDAQVHPFD